MQAYSERLSPPPAWWGLAGVAGISCGLVGLVFGAVPALIALVAGFMAAAAGLNSYGSARLTVTSTDLIAGRARIPLTALGEGTALDAEQARALRMEGADPRAFMLLRSYIPTAARITIDDPSDPTPYLYLSSRNPQRLIDVVEAVRGRAETAADGTRPAG